MPERSKLWRSSSFFCPVFTCAYVTQQLAARRVQTEVERTARTAIWNDAFQELGGFVQVGFKDGAQRLGWVRYHSDDVSDPSLFLEQAAWVDGDREVPIEGPGILVTKRSGIETVTFLSWTTPHKEDESAPPEREQVL